MASSMIMLAAKATLNFLAADVDNRNIVAFINRAFAKACTIADVLPPVWDSRLKPEYP